MCGVFQPHSATSGGASGLEHIPTSHAACVGPAPRAGILSPQVRLCVSSLLCVTRHPANTTVSLSPEGRGRGPSDERGRGASGQWPRVGFHVGPRPLLRLILLCLSSAWLHPVLYCGVFFSVSWVPQGRGQSHSDFCYR